MWSSISSPNKALPLAGALLASLTSAIPMSMSSSVSPSAHPTPISISASLVANVAQNTHTSTVGPNGKPTSIPIVGGPDCWFCPEADEDDDDDNAGWALMGLDAPGTYIPSPAPSGFSDPMPPITVEANGNPSYGPSPTEDEDEEPTKVKRSPIPTKTHYVDSSKFKSLDSTVKNKKWQDKEGWAIQAAQPPTGVVPIPNHFLVVAGYVHITPKDREERDDCGELKQVVRTITRDYDGFLYDISAPDGKKIIMVPRGESGATWDNGKKGFTYSSLGAIKDGLSKDKIKEIGESIAKNMGPYSYATNNCRTFVNKLYDHIKK